MLPVRKTSRRNHLRKTAALKVARRIQERTAAKEKTVNEPVEVHEDYIQFIDSANKHVETAMISATVFTFNLVDAKIKGIMRESISSEDKLNKIQKLIGNVLAQAKDALHE